jgi:hypothetical protein
MVQVFAAAVAVTATAVFAAVSFVIYLHRNHTAWFAAKTA